MKTVRSSSRIDQRIVRTSGWIMVFTVVLTVASLVLFLPKFSNAAGGSSIDLLASGWGYMPGVVASSDGLHVTYLGRAIVRQDGSPGQLNPPVNIYGTHMNVVGDFALTANLQDISGTASLQLYSDAPIVQDEFRVIPKSVELSLSGATLTVSTWNGYTNQKLYAQKPSTTNSYLIQQHQNNSIQVVRQGENISFSVNGQQIATIPNRSLTSNAVWFGMSADKPGDSWTLRGLSAEPLANGKVTSVNTEDVSVYPKATDGLQTLASKKRPGFLVGAAMPSAPTVADSQYARLAFGGNFGSMTPENAMKWQFIHPQPGIYDFKEADGLVDLARKNGLVVHGHALVFGEANPAWVQNLQVTSASDKAKVKDTMIDHITQTVSHFKGRVAEWDVVNEPLAEDIDENSVYRDHIWYKAMGEEYIGTAFRAAHAADPQAKLYLNEFGLEENGDRWDTFFALVSKLKSTGVPIDGVGFQAHVYEQGDTINPSVLRDHIQKLAAIGLVSRISEMDVYGDDGTDAQSAQYADVLSTCMSEPSCVSWTIWGISDRYDYFMADSGRLDRGQDFLWDGRYSPTSAVTAIKGILTR